MEQKEKKNRHSMGEKIILASGIVALVSLFLPWRDMGIASVNGISHQAWLPFLLAWSLPVFMYFKPINIKTVIPLIGDLIALIWGIVYIFSSNTEHPFTGKSVNVAASGVIIFCLAALGLGIGLILRNKGKKACDAEKSEE